MEHSLITRLRLRMADPGTKFESPALAVAEILHGVQNSKTGQRAFQGRFSIGTVGLATVNQCTKFEVSRFTRYEAMNGGAKCRKKDGWFGAVRGHSRSWAVKPFDTAHTTSYLTLMELCIYLLPSRYSRLFVESRRL